MDNEQYRLWVASRWGVELEGGEGFRAIHRLLGSAVEYRRMDAFELDRLEERFDLVYCFGILHRVENPLGLLRVLRGRTVSGGTRAGRDLRRPPGRSRRPAIRVSEPGEVYARDEFVYWGFGHAGLRAACPDRRLLARRVARRRGGRRPPAHHGPADRLERSRTAVSTVSPLDGYGRVTAEHARVATLRRRPRRFRPIVLAGSTARTRRRRRSRGRCAGPRPRADCCLTAGGGLVLLRDP